MTILNHVMPRRRPKRRQLIRKPLIGESLESRNLLATFAVTSAIDGTPGDLRSAVLAANAAAGPDLITFSVPSLSLTLGEIVISDEVHIDGASAGHVDISQTTPDRIFRVDDAAPGLIPVSMDELTLRGGVASTGGAILNREMLELRNSTITGNTATAGGAVFNEGALFRMSNSAIYDNSARYEGGGIMNVSGALEIIESEIRINRVFNSNNVPTFGGGIRNLGLATAVLEDSFVLGNAAYAGPNTQAYGGGIANQLESVAHLIGSTVGDNYATTSGGGIWNLDGSWLISEMNPNTGNSSAVFGNVSGESGGGIYLRNAMGDVRDTLITGNITELRGGGVAVGNDVTLTMNNVDVSDNTTNFFSADGSGGGLYLSSFGLPNGPIVDIADSRIERNNVDPNGSAGGEFGGGITARYGTQLTLTNTLVSQNKASNSGAGLYLSDAFSPHAPTTHIHDSVISGNVSSNLGGGITAAGGLLEISHTEIEANVAYSKGGGLFMTGLLSTIPLDAQLRHSAIRDNFAPVEGGGAAAGPNMMLTLDDTEVTGNRTHGRGAGLYLSGLGLPTFPNDSRIVNSQIANNVATYDPSGPPYSYASGGGVWAGPAANLSVETTTISGNGADRYGGGIMANEGDISLRDSTLTGNAAKAGGGAYVKNAHALLEQLTWSANKADEDGGAMSIFSFLGSAVDIVSNTMSLNQADADLDGSGTGGGILVSDDPLNNVVVAMHHSIVAGNFAGSQLFVPHNNDLHDGPGLAGNPPVSLSYNLIGSRLGNTLAVANPDPNGNIVGSALFPVDAKLSPIGNHGGPTETMVPQPGSPAIDTGDPLFLGVAPFDQRQAPFTRAVGRIDMGSVEVQTTFPGPDLNFDGSVNGDDINLLTSAIAASTYVAGYDMDGDGILGDVDISRWLCKAGHINLGPNLSYRVGDANLDGIVDALDFIQWNSHRFTNNADWTNGDFNASGVIDGQDFISWNANKFQGPFVCNPLPITNGGDGPRIDPPALDQLDGFRTDAVRREKRASRNDAAVIDSPASVEPTNLGLPAHQQLQTDWVFSIAGADRASLDAHHEQTLENCIQDLALATNSDLARNLNACVA